ncbi:TKL protein kinase [Phytophthora megakarya]|uniref:TKL protein kinase n=1 Tax=Phytophthora megakarya TaxID=4795 RepID=A0A225VT38_9STRA|nr:TKL protein kinase [Phytophthora megakarya]
MAINLSTRIYDVPDMIPSSIVSLSLANTLLTEFPVHLTSLSNVVTLHLNDNYITTVNSSVSWEKLVVLDLYQNNIATFEGNFPGLTELYLNGNNLTEIPVIIYTLKHLTTLAIQNNPLESRSFTEAQIIFLQTLIRLDLVNSDFQNAVNCSLPEQRTIGNNIVVCVSDFSPQSDSLDSLSPASGVPVSSISYSSGSTSVDNDHSNSGAGRTSFPLIAFVVTAIVVFIALSSTAIYYWKQHNGEKTRMVYNNVNRRPSKHQATVLDGNQHLPEVNCDDIEDIRVIGRGAFTTVWLIRYQNSVLLASKRLREDADSERTQAFMEEIKLMSKLDHPNIVAFVGAAWTTKSNFQALFEFVENGDLHSYLAPSLPRYWTRAKLQLAVDVVEALVYIHAFTPSLVHQNLNSHNVLITTDMQAKLIDVGVPWFPPTPTQITMRTRTASRWLAPEIISGSSEYNHSADIFAFGVLLSEFDTHELPYENATSVNGSRLEEMTILRRVANTTLRPAFSNTCPPIILELAKQCMDHEPRNRPPALKIAYALRTLQREAFNM